MPGAPPGCGGGGRGERGDGAKTPLEGPRQRKRKGRGGEARASPPGSPRAGGCLRVGTARVPCRAAARARGASAGDGGSPPPPFPPSAARLSSSPGRKSAVSLLSLSPPKAVRRRPAPAPEAVSAAFLFGSRLRDGGLSFSPSLLFPLPPVVRLRLSRSLSPSLSLPRARGRARGGGAEGGGGPGVRGPRGERERGGTAGVGVFCRPSGRAAFSGLRPQIRRGDPLNLSILVSGGKETNEDSLSNSERRGKSPAPNPRPAVGRGTCGVQKPPSPAALSGDPSPCDRGRSPRTV